MTGYDPELNSGIQAGNPYELIDGSRIWVVGGKMHGIRLKRRDNILADENPEVSEDSSSEEVTDR